MLLMSRVPGVDRDLEMERSEGIVMRSDFEEGCGRGGFNEVGANAGGMVGEAFDEVGINENGEDTGIGVGMGAGERVGTGRDMERVI